MKYIITIVIVIIVALIMYNQFGGKNKNSAINKNVRIPETSEQQQTTLTTFEKIKREEYTRFILTKNTTKNYLLKSIEEFGALSGNEDYTVYHFGITEYKDWKFIKVDPAISFYKYHNLVGWLMGYEENTEIPDLSIGFSKHKTDTEKDYLFFLDPTNEYGDTHIGAFRNEKTFSIFLPEAYEDYGNLTIKDEIHFSFNKHIEYFAVQGFNISNIESLNYTEYKITMNE